MGITNVLGLHAIQLPQMPFILVSDGFFLSIGLVFHLYITMAVGAILTVLDVIAVIVDQKKKTIRIEDL